MYDNIGKSPVGNFRKVVSMDLKDILPEFQTVLREGRIAHEKSIPYYGVWVSKFLSLPITTPLGDVESEALAFIDRHY